ncbi:MAG: hypothetical protein JWN37_404 [Candidatus Nomurabacteria bacterium]|nr:hypothetical protein [Candidatus Nomurabacteria bacterium]
MTHFPTPGIAEKIVELLKTGPKKTADILKYFDNKNVTSQGIYKALRTLKNQQIVLVSKKEAVLNQSWLQDIQKFALLAEHAYRTPSGDGHFLQMGDGDKITYEFKNPILVDAFWNHVLYVLFDALPNIDRWYAYASHNWFMIARKKEELSLRDYMNSREIKYLFTTGNKTPLDRAITKEFDGNMSQYYMRDSPLFENRPNNLGIVLNIIGDYIIEARYDKDITNKIEKFYKENKVITNENIKELESIVSSPSKIRFIINRNKSKAKKLSTLLEKNFYVGKKYYK